MSFLDDAGLPGSDALNAFSGKTGAEAALEAAAGQARIGREGLALNEETLKRLEATLAPFVQAGQGTLAQGSALFGPNAASNIQQDPTFQAAANRTLQSTLASQAARGRTGAGETPLALQTGISNLGADFLSRQRGDLLSSIGLGQASAAQQAAGGLQSGQRASDLLTQIGNAQAAGGIGASNALGQGSSNIASAAGGLLAFFSDPRTKTNVSPHGKYKGHNTYKYQYKGCDNWYIGVMSDEVRNRTPEAVTVVDGIDVVDYARL